MTQLTAPAPATPPGPANPGQSQRQRRLRSSKLPLAVMTPGLVLMAVMIVYPVLGSIRISFGSWPGTGPVTLTGLDNYRRLVHDSQFWSSVTISLVFFLAVTVVTMVLAILLANAISRGVPGARFFKVVWFLPVIVPVSVSGVFWSNALQPNTGVVNAVLGLLGLGSGHAWLATGTTALWCVVFVAVWLQAGYATLILLGAMEAIGQDVHEAATLDGVGAVSRLFRITLPNIVPMLGTVASLMSVFSFNAFGVIYGMTNGGPANATQILPVLVYKQAFINQAYGYGSAISVFTTILVGIIGVLVLRAFRQQALEG